jgi:hypothetical protein
LTGKYTGVEEKEKSAGRVRKETALQGKGKQLVLEQNRDLLVNSTEVEERGQYTETLERVAGL